MITLSFIGNTDSTLFTLTPATCTLISAATCSIDVDLAKDIDVDAEDAQFSILELQVSDSKLTNVYSFPYVTNAVNEFAPVFVNLPGAVSIPENTPIVGGAAIFTVVATDADSDVTGDGQVPSLKIQQLIWSVYKSSRIEI